MTDESLAHYRERLRTILAGCDSAMIAVSGGVDSTFLLASAQDVLGERAVGVTAVSPIHPVRETRYAETVAENLGVKLLTVESEEMDSLKFLENTGKRCYICKGMLFDKIRKLASSLGIASILHGENVDDLEDFRPGYTAAQELGVDAPLIKAGLNKERIRLLSREMGLPSWNKPSSPCLATRIPCGSPITLKKLKMIEEAEDLLTASGFLQCRVRHYGKLAKIEVAADMLEHVWKKDNRMKMTEELKRIGFERIALDMDGYDL